MDLWVNVQWHLHIHNKRLFFATDIDCSRVARANGSRASLSGSGQID